MERLQGHTERFRSPTLAGVRHRLIERMDEMGFTQESLAHEIGVHPKTVGKWVRGLGKPRATWRQALAAALGWTAADVLRAFSDNADAPLEIYRYRAPATGLDMLAGLEQSCRHLRTLELSICPGLLQTPAYAEAVESLDPESPPPDEVARRVAERMKRQERALDKDDPLQVSALLAPSVVSTLVGGGQVMAELLVHLRELDRRPNISIRVLSPAGAIAVARGPFKLFTGDDPDPFVVVTDDLATGLSYRDGPSVVKVHHDMWRHIWSVSDALA